ncbi:MAG: 2-amino-4-hydroxy-6-hydroxymethyldihydropteridine diphosphokinase [Deltaproteobacteria bacterium]
MPRCYISLGGNLGSVGDAFDSALGRLKQAPGTTVVAVSRFHQTQPVGEQSGGGFLNAAAEIDTGLLPLEVLDLLQKIEADLGRVRTFRWGPRTIDLDLLFYGSEIIDSPRLVVPHPAAWYRRFVLDPLVEIAPHFVHPERQVEIETLRNRLLRRPLVAALAGGLPEVRFALFRTLACVFPTVKFVEWERDERQLADSESEPILVVWLGAARGPDAPPAVEFHQLPVISQVDATKASEPVEEFVRHVLQSALG